MRRILVPFLLALVLGCGLRRRRRARVGMAQPRRPSSRPARGQRLRDGRRPGGEAGRRPDRADGGARGGHDLRARRRDELRRLPITLDPKQAPKTSASVVSLAENGFYDGTTFHRVVPGFVIQGGDPTGTGSGGPGYSTVDASRAPPTPRGRRDGEGRQRAAWSLREPVLRRHRPDAAPARLRRLGSGPPRGWRR